VVALVGCARVAFVALVGFWRVSRGCAFGRGALVRVWGEILAFSACLRFARYFGARIV
jgi:hypothetical protein